MNYKTRLIDINNILQQRIGQRNIIVAKQSELLANQVQLKDTIQLYNSARRLLEIFTKGTEIKIRQYIEPIITEALDFVFDQGLRFHLLFITRRNQMEVDFLIIRNVETEKKFQIYVQDQTKYGKQLEQLVKETKNITDTFGGAVNQVLSCILRFVISELLHIKGPIVLDEPSSAVHPTYAIRLGQLISSLSKRFNRQYIIVTHSRELAEFADKIYEINQVKGISEAEEMRI